MNDVELWRELGQQLRVDAIRPAAKAGSGHPTSGMSAADLMAVLLAKYLRYDFANPHDPHNDRLVFSKGHASTLLYAIFRAVGAISEDELRSEEHTSELQSRRDLVCRLLLEKKKKKKKRNFFCKKKKKKKKI